MSPAICLGLRDQIIREFVSGLAAIGEDMTQSREALEDFREHQRRTVAILDIGGVDHGMNQIALGVGEDVALAAVTARSGAQSACMKRRLVRAPAQLRPLTP